MSRVRGFLRRRGFDLALLAGSGACFGLFVQGSLQMRELSGIGGPVATMREGRGERKASGSPAYVAAAPGTEFFNLDTLWVGKQLSCKLELDDRKLLELPERTLIVLKRPFRGGSVGAFEDKVVVLKGEVLVKGETKARTPPRAMGSPEIPDGRKRGPRSAAPQKLNPQEEAILYLKPEDRLVSFAWPDPLSGYVAIRNGTTGRVLYQEVRNERYAKVRLPEDAEYLWQVIGEDREPLLGPFKFELRMFRGADTARKLDLKKLDGKVEIHW
jgi:hypothetical protein